MIILNPDTKIHKLSREQGRAIIGKTLPDGTYYNPVLTLDMDIVITEQEVVQTDKKEYPFIDEANLLYPAELSKQSLDEQAKLEAYKADIENNLAEVTAKLDAMSQEAIQGIQIDQVPKSK